MEPRRPIRLLVVDDDPLIQELLLVTLEDAGFAPTSAANGEQASEFLMTAIDGLRGVVTDIQLGGKLSGWDVGRKARELNPAIPVLYITGDSGADWATKGVGNSVLLNKPFVAAQIVTAVCQLLNRCAML